MDYGCDVSNRYTGYLDSSDHGNSLNNSNIGKNKRKNKKKRKPKNKVFNKKQIVGADQNSESTDIGDLIENQQQQQPLQIFSNDNEHDEKLDNYQQMTKNHETDSNSTDFPKSLPSYYSPTILSDISQDEFIEENEMDDNNYGIDDVSKDLGRKWSVICFEEEKSLLERKKNITEVEEEEPDEQEEHKESQFKDDSDTFSKTLEEPELMFSHHRVYPTVYFYNSSFGNRHRRTVDWHNSSRRLPNINSSQHFIKNDDIEKTNYEKKKKRRYGKRQKRYNKATETGIGDNNPDDNNKNEIHSVDEKNYADSHNESNDHTSQHTNESNSTANNYREYINAKNRYNQFKHGANVHSERTFTRRRRSDFVRNV